MLCRAAAGRGFACYRRSRWVLWWSGTSERRCMLQ
jgi:hypothetical protein